MKEEESTVAQVLISITQVHVASWFHVDTILLFE